MLMLRLCLVWSYKLESLNGDDIRSKIPIEKIPIHWVLDNVPEAK